MSRSRGPTTTAGSIESMSELDSDSVNVLRKSATKGCMREDKSAKTAQQPAGLIKARKFSLRSSASGRTSANIAKIVQPSPRRCSRSMPSMQLAMQVSEVN